MPEWIWLDKQVVNKPRPQKIQGVRVNLRLSPYDVPEGVRGRQDPKTGLFVIEFRYIGGEEATRDVKGHDHVVMKVGKISNRLHAIEIDTKALGVEKVNLVTEVDHAIDRLAHQRDRRTRQSNYDLARQVISAESGNLFAPLGC